MLHYRRSKFITPGGFLNDVRRCRPFVNCRYTDCAIPCPVEAFHLDDDMLVINPETCIDCDACVPECPVEAVFAEDKLPGEWSHFTQINSERALSGLPTINVRLDPLCQ